MKNCLNENPCNQGYKNPCHDYKNPCQGVREDEVVIKQYIDECGRKVYPITTDSAVLLEDGSNLKEALQNYITYLNSIQEELSNLKGDHSEYNEKFLDVIARIRILEKMQSNPYTFDITSIVSRLTALEAKSNLGCDAERIDECYTLCNLILVAINNINTQIQELFNLIGEDCISDFSTPFTTIDSSEIVHRNSESRLGRDIVIGDKWPRNVKIYKVTPGSILNIKINALVTGTFASRDGFNRAVGATYEPYQFYTKVLSSDYSGNDYITGDLAGGAYNVVNALWPQNGELQSSTTTLLGDVTVPSNAKCIAVTETHYNTSEKTVNANVVITLNECPDSEISYNDEFEEWIGNLKNDYKNLQKVLDKIKVSDVQFAGESIIDNKKIATIPPFVAIHGYIKPTDSLSRWREYKDLNNIWLEKSEYVYNTGYFLNDSLRNYSRDAAKINRGILLPVTKLYDYALYNKNLDLYTDWNNQKGNYLLRDHPGMEYLDGPNKLTKGVIWASPALYDKTVTPNKQKCGATTNYVVDFYDLSNISDKVQYYNLKITFKNQYGSSCRYSLFKSSCFGLNYPDATHLDSAKHISGADNKTVLSDFNSNLIETSNVYMNCANETTFITLEDIPSTAKTLCVAYHSFGSAVVEKLPKKLTNNNGSLSVPAHNSITIEGVTLQESDAISSACAKTGLTSTSSNGNVTITNNTNDTITIALQLESNRKIIWNEEPVEMDETPTPMENVPMLTIPRPLTAVVVNYYNEIAPTDTNPTVIPFNLVPRVPFYEIDTLRFMYIDESGRFYEC